MSTKRFTNCNFNMYTEMAFGKEAEKQVGALVKKYGGTKVLLVYGGGSIKRSGLYDTVVASLNEAGIPFVELGGVQPNPRKSLVLKGIELARAEKCDFFLGVGGGSSIDTAKAIALGVEDDGFWDIYCGKKAASKMAPVGAIVTIAAAGSEMSGSSVVLDDIDSHKKHGIMNPNVVRPVFTIINPELTYTVSPYQTAAGAADIFSHTFERFFNKNTSNLADAFGAALLKNVVKFSRRAIADPEDYEARAELALMAPFSHNELTAIGRAGSPFTAHSLEQQISAKYDTAHGAALAMLIPAYLERIVEEGTDEEIARVAKLAVEVFEVTPDPEDLKAVATEGIRRYRQWNTDIGMPNKLSELNIPAEDIPEIVANVRQSPEHVVLGFMEMPRPVVERLFYSLV